MVATGSSLIYFLGRAIREFLENFVEKRVKIIDRRVRILRLFIFKVKGNNQRTFDTADLFEKSYDLFCWLLFADCNYQANRKRRIWFFNFLNSLLNRFKIIFQVILRIVKIQRLSSQFYSLIALLGQSIKNITQIMFKQLFLSEQCQHISPFLVENFPEIFLIFYSFYLIFAHRSKRIQWALINFFPLIFFLHTIYELMVWVFPNSADIEIIHLELNDKKSTKFRSWQKCRWPEWSPPFGMDSMRL